MSRIWLGIHYSFDITEGLKLGRSVGAYVYQNFLLPRTSPAPDGGTGPVLLTSTHVTAVGDTNITLGSTQLVDARGAGLPGGRSAVFLVRTDVSTTSTASDTHAMEPSRARLEGAQPQTRRGSVDGVFGSADPWEERFAPAP